MGNSFRSSRQEIQSLRDIILEDIRRRDEESRRRDEESQRSGEESRGLDEDIRAMKNDIRVMLSLNSLTLNSLNVYDAMPTTQSSRLSDLKLRFCSTFDYVPGYCMASREIGNSRLAHILPLSSQKSSSVMSLLQLTVEMLNDFRNLLLLSTNIEECFDSLKLSFLPRLGDGMRETFVMHIWDESIREMPIFPSSSRKIGEYEGIALNFAMGHFVYRRCLAFQSLWACSKHLGGNFRGDAMPFRIDSLDPHQQELFLGLLQAQQQELFRSIAMEI